MSNPVEEIIALTKRAAVENDKKILDWLDRQTDRCFKQMSLEEIDQSLSLLNELIAETEEEIAATIKLRNQQWPQFKLRLVKSNEGEGA